MRLVLPELVVRLDGSAPEAALFHPTLNGDAVVLNAITLAGPWQSGNRTVYVLELGPELLLPSSEKLLSLSVEEETLVAPLRGLMPRMTLSTPLANCYAPSIVSVSALPVNESGNLAQQGWDAAVRATVGLQIVFSEGVASRAEDGTLSPLDATSFHIVTPNGTKVLEVRMSTSTGVRRVRRRLLDAEAYVSEAVILLGVPATPGDGELVGLSVLEGRVVNEQGNAIVGGRMVWADLEPGLPTSSNCPWLGGMMASALMAALSLLELSKRLLPEKVCICRWRRGIPRKSRYISSEPAPAVSLPRETLPSSPPPSPPAAPLGNRTITIVKLEEGTCLFHRRIGRASFATVEVLSAASEAAVSNEPTLGRVVWMMSLVATAFLFAWGGATARQVMSYTVVPLLPVWLAQGFLLSAQCGKRQSGRALLPALRTLGVWVMSIAVAFVTAIPSATHLSPLRRLVIVGPTALVAALFIAIDTMSSRRIVKKQTAPSGEKPAGRQHWSPESCSSEFGSTRSSTIQRDPADNEERDASRLATRAVWTVAAGEAACKCRTVAADAQRGSTSSPSSSLSSSPSSSCQKTTCNYQLPPGYFKRQEQRLGLQLLWTRQARVVLPSPRPLCRSRSVALLRELGTEALGSLTLLITVLMTVVGVPLYGVGDGTFSCHSTQVSVFGTVTALLAPLSLGLVRRVRWQDIEQGVDKSVKVSRAMMQKGGKFTKGVRMISLRPALATSPAATPAASLCLSMMLASPAAAPAATPAATPAAAAAATMAAALVLPSSLPFAIDDDGGGGATEAANPAAPAPAAHVNAFSLTAAVLPLQPLPRRRRMKPKAAGVDAVLQSTIQDRVPLQKNFSSSSRSSFARFAALRKQHASATRNPESVPAPLAAYEKKPWGKRCSIAPCDDRSSEGKKRLSSASGSYFVGCA